MSERFGPAVNDPIRLFPRSEFDVPRHSGYLETPFRTITHLSDNNVLPECFVVEVAD